MSYLIWSGVSKLDKKTRIQLVATDHSTNSKTGDMVQTWILVENEHPVLAERSGLDHAICGNCIHRKSDTKKRTCYVNIGMGVAAVYRSKKKAPPTNLTQGRMVRLGAYGDPAAVPIAIWKKFLRGAKGWTGYTHQWRSQPAFKSLCMASVDSLEETNEARAKGWRTYRVAPTCETDLLPNEVICPTEHTDLQCIQCGYCNGGARRGSVMIPVHGTVGHINAFNKFKGIEVVQNRTTCYA